MPEPLAVAYFGDGAVHQGVFHEAMGLAKLWNAPVIMACENNQYTEATAAESHLNTKTVADMACAYDLPARTEDGMDAMAVHAATEEVVARARDAGGATLLEFVSYRFAGQFEGDRATYQPQEEIHTLVGARAVGGPWNAPPGRRASRRRTCARPCGA